MKKKLGECGSNFCGSHSQAIVVEYLPNNKAIPLCPLCAESTEQIWAYVGGCVYDYYTMGDEVSFVPDTDRQHIPGTVKIVVEKDKDEITV